MKLIIDLAYQPHILPTYKILKINMHAVRLKVKKIKKILPSCL